MAKDIARMSLDELLNHANFARLEESMIGTNGMSYDDIIKRNQPNAFYLEQKARKGRAWVPLTVITYKKVRNMNYCGLYEIPASDIEIAAARSMVIDLDKREPKFEGSRVALYLMQLLGLKRFPSKI